tara:strand:- start:384 stop:632 length:249 start_codon:yes stop_codon:yes gene_type:complete
MSNYITFIFICLIIFFLVILKKQGKSSIRNKKRIIPMKDWMLMSKKERKDYDDNIRNQTLKRKRILLDNIRKEYVNVSRNNK